MNKAAIYQEENLDLFEKPMEKDQFTLLRMFTNYRNIDLPQNWDDLIWRYHSAYDDPTGPKSSWSAKRLRRAIDAAEAHGLIEYQRDHKWMITDRGLEARQAETVRRMRGG